MLLFFIFIFQTIFYNLPSKIMSSFELTMKAHVKNVNEQMKIMKSHLKAKLGIYDFDDALPSKDLTPPNQRLIEIPFVYYILNFVVFMCFSNYISFLFVYDFLSPSSQLAAYRSKDFYKSPQEVFLIE